MEIKSSNLYFENLMAWAQKKSRQFVMTGTERGEINKGDGGKWYGPSGRFSVMNKKIRKPNKPWAEPKDYIPSYWAGYYDRTAFYIRDFVHQASGAEFLGYHEENYHMLKSFVSHASAETGWYAPWALNFDGSIYYLDTPNNKRFVREILGQYELVEVICSLYFLTGDERYLDKSFADYCENILGEFTSSRDGIVLAEKNGIPEGVGNLWKGSASYNESGIAFAEAGDCIASLYRALVLYSKFSGKSEYSLRAEKLKKYFNEEWSRIPGTDDFAFGIDKNGKKHHKWTKSARGIIGAETCFIMPIKFLTEPGARNDALLDEIDSRARDKKTCMPNIESYTYLPQVFFPYNRAEQGWHWMKYIGDRVENRHVKASQGKNGDYPEISFTLISSALQGLLGLSVNAAENKAETCPCLPQDIPDISAQGIKLGEIAFDIEFKDSETARFRNLSDKEITWKCAFAGDFSSVNINGEAVECKKETVNGVLRSFAEICVKPQETASVKA